MALFGYSRSLCDTRNVTAEPKAKAASPRGLEGVIAGETELSKVDGAKGEHRATALATSEDLK